MLHPRRPGACSYTMNAVNQLRQIAERLRDIAPYLERRNAREADHLADASEALAETLERGTDSQANHQRTAT